MLRIEAAFALMAAAGMAAGGTAAPAPVRVGVLEQAADAGELGAGAAQAAAELNAAGGLGGHPVELVRVASSRPWHDGASLTARLAFEHDVIALVGPSGGGAAHVAAQVAARKRIPVLSTAPEDALTRAYVPWVFRGVPGDGAQARALLAHLSAEGPVRAAALAVPDGRDGRERLASLTAVCGELDIEVRSVWRGPWTAVPPEVAAADVLLLWLDPGDALAVLRSPGLPRLLAGSTRLDHADFWAQAPPAADGLLLPLLRDVDGRSMTHALGYDLMRALAAAAAGPGELTPRRLQQNLLAGAPFTGRTGDFRFDGHGNRVGAIPVARVRGGRPRVLAQRQAEARIHRNLAIPTAGGTP